MTDKWKKIKEEAKPALEALKNHPWKSSMSLVEMIERQAEEGNEIERMKNEETIQH